MLKDYVLTCHDCGVVVDLRDYEGYDMLLEAITFQIVHGAHENTSVVDKSEAEEAGENDGIE